MQCFQGPVRTLHVDRVGGQRANDRIQTMDTHGRTTHVFCTTVANMSHEMYDDSHGISIDQINGAVWCGCHYNRMYLQRIFCALIDYINKL